MFMDIIQTSEKKYKLLQSLEGGEQQAWNKPHGKLLERAAVHLDQLEFPGRKSEYWKYTRTNLIANNPFEFASEELSVDFSAYLPKNLDCHTMVFVNGFLNAKHSTITRNEQLSVASLEYAAESEKEKFNTYFGRTLNTKDHIFSALNTNYRHNGAYVRIKGVLDKPVHIIHITSGETTINQPRNLVIAERSSEAKMIFSYLSLGSGKTFTNGATEIFVEENANLSIQKLQDFNSRSFQQITEEVEQASNSTFTLNTFHINGGWARNNVNCALKGENITSNLNGLYQPQGSEHVDNHTVIDHLKPNCLSNELYKGVLNDKSTGVFNGKVFVRPDAQKTNAFQSNANILLSDFATMNSKPELEIYADDVKCSHGSTTGQFDEDAVFYLRARGLSETSAKKLLVKAFAAGVLDQINIPQFRELVEDLYDKKFRMY